MNAKQDLQKEYWPVLAPSLLGFDRDGSQSILILFRELPPLGVNFRWTDHTSLKFEQTDIAELRSQMLHAIRSLQAAQQSSAAC